VHELSIAESIIAGVLREREEQGLSAVSEIGIRIGALSGVFPDALLFGYEALSADSELAGVPLKIENVPAQGTCRSCRAFVTLSAPPFLCQECGVGTIDLERGQELEIAYIEGVRNSSLGRAGEGKI
jgi:hydrogenase nickel incorporation protein HypA/HybF